MPNILPVSDLRNYNEVLKSCVVREPVFITKNGRGKFVVMDIEDYEREKAEKKLIIKLQEAEETAKDESAWISLGELKASVGVQSMINCVLILQLRRIKNIKEYITEDNEEMAVKTIREIYNHIENIQQILYMGADLSKRVSFRMNYKYAIFGSYVVLYRIGDEYVEIYRGESLLGYYRDILLELQIACVK